MATGREMSLDRYLHFSFTGKKIYPRDDTRSRKESNFIGRKTRRVITASVWEEEGVASVSIQGRFLLAPRHRAIPYPSFFTRRKRRHRERYKPMQTFSFTIYFFFFSLSFFISIREKRDWIADWNYYG